MKIRCMRRIIIIFAIFIISISSIFAQPLPGSYYDFIEETWDMEVTHPKNKLIIYRPQNNSQINDVRCYLRLEDENGNDVTKTACTATYEWPEMTYWDSKKMNRTLPQTFNQRKPELHAYKRDYYVSGGMAMHLTLKKGKYKISFYTPKDKQENFIYPIAGKRPFQWESNVFEYNTQNPAKVIFISPTTNDNGFYNGGWYIDYKSPTYLKNMTIPKQEDIIN